MIGGALWLGLRRQWSQFDWRVTKLLSALLGAVGIAMLLANFEKTTYDSLIDKSKRYAFAEFLDTKFFIAHSLSIACARDQGIEKNRLTCFDYKNIDGQVSSFWVRNSIPFKEITNWQRNPEIDEFVVEVNRRLKNINDAMPPFEESTEIISDTYRAHFLILSAFLVTIAIAGSVGEAAFQLRLAIDERRASSKRSV